MHLMNSEKLGCGFGAFANGFTTIAPLRPGGTVKELEYRVDLGPENIQRLRAELDRVQCIDRWWML